MDELLLSSCSVCVLLIHDSLQLYSHSFPISVTLQAINYVQHLQFVNKLRFIGNISKHRINAQTQWCMCF